MLTTRILRSVEGLANKFNDIIYKSPKELIPNVVNKEIVCYFGGDVQDLRSNMESNQNSDYNQFVDYCLENMTNILSEKYKTSHVFVIRANRFHDKTYAVYDNFVDSNSIGCPKHHFKKEPLNHFRHLLLNSFNLLNIDLDFNRDVKIVLIGFSKGCVVLNQFLYSFYISLDDIELKKLIERIVLMNWCDGGHSGTSNTWITAPEVLRRFSQLSIGVHINVSPYQMMSPYRPWIANEEKLFYETLTQLGTNPQRVLHFAGEDISLEMHFRVLNHFL